MTVELKPCPFCGGEARLLTPARLKLEGDYYVEIGSEYHLAFAIYEKDGNVVHNFLHGLAIMCLNCDANMPNIYSDDDEKELVEAWNERKDPNDNDDNAPMPGPPGST